MLEQCGDQQRSGRENDVFWEWLLSGDFLVRFGFYNLDELFEMFRRHRFA